MPHDAGRHPRVGAAFRARPSGVRPLLVVFLECGHSWLHTYILYVAFRALRLRVPRIASVGNPFSGATSFLSLGSRGKSNPLPPGPGGHDNFYRKGEENSMRLIGPDNSETGQPMSSIICVRGDNRPGEGLAA